MFKDLLSFWKGKDFLLQVMEDFKIMLDEAESMFQLVCARLTGGTDEPELKERIYRIDKKINDLQKEIRRRIVEHLSLQPTVDVNACLILMSVVKDAERLGDYAKNLYEVTELLEHPIDKSLYSRYFDSLNDDIVTLFGRTRDAFVEGNEDKAKSAWDYEGRIAKGCDMSVNEAVCLALVARHFKRIVAHLVNIATAVILPLSDLDYFDEKTRED